MKENFNEKTKIEEMACLLLSDIIDIPYLPKYLTEQHKLDSEYRDKLEKDFEDSLSYEQMQDYDCLMSVKNSVSATEFSYMLLCGMQLKAAIDEIIKDPLRILRLYDADGELASNLYKPVKKKKEGRTNEQL